MATDKHIDCFASWLDTTEDQQMKDLEDYCASKKIVLPAPPQPASPVERLLSIISHCGPLFQEASPSPQEANDCEGVFFSIASLLCIVPAPRTREVLQLFCQQLTSSSPVNAPVKLKLLSLMYAHFPQGEALKFVVLEHRLQYSAEHKLGALLAADPAKASRWVKECCQESNQTTRQVYAHLWQTYKVSNRSMAVKFLLELVQTYVSAEEAGQGAGLARELVVELVMDSQQFVFDSALQLPAVVALKGEPLHKLLEIFVSGKLSNFKDFHSQHPSLFSDSGLDYQKCLRKIQLLTLVSMATEAKELEFDCLYSELDLEPESLETTIIEAVRLDLVKAAVDQVNRKIIISGAVQRTFSRDQWQTLLDKLTNSHRNIETVLQRFSSLPRKA